MDEFGPLAASYGRPDAVGADPQDPVTSLRLGARYLRRQLERFAALPRGRKLAIAAYDAGAGAVEEWPAADPLADERERLGAWLTNPETRASARRVLA